MQTLLDFLSFKSFISPSVLIVCYYLGALGAPLAMLGTLIWARHGAKQANKALPPKTSAYGRAGSPIKTDSSCSSFS